MKKPMTGFVALLAGAFTGYSQGTVSFANYLALPSYIYVSLVNDRLSPPYYPTVLLGGSSTVTTGNVVTDAANGFDWTVELYGNVGANDPAGSLVPAIVDGTSANPIAMTTLLESGRTDTVPGTWFSTAIADIPGTTYANQAATVQIYAWYNDGGRVTSYAAALADGYPVGFSATANILTGGPRLSAPPLPPANLPIFGPGIPGYGVEITSVPEPGTIALALIGAATFLPRLRRKA
jgi:hypothetical protein